MPLGLRLPECITLVFFAYIALLAAFFRDRPHLHLQPLVLVCVAGAFLLGLARLPHVRAVNIARDWLPLGYTFVAFREMELFAPAQYDLHLEKNWIKLDQLLLGDWHWRAAIESAGVMFPFYLEFCYLLVYGLAVYSLTWVAFTASRRAIDWFWTIYLTGTLTAYGMFPYFPSLPPRYAFPLVEPPTLITPIRTFNLWLLQNATIHSGVFPSAHVSSAFSATWALYFLLPRYRWVAHGMLFYSLSVSLATIYGRYHYAIDVLAGFGVSLIAAAVGLALKKREGIEYVQEY